MSTTSTSLPADPTATPPPNPLSPNPNAPAFRPSPTRAVTLSGTTYQYKGRAASQPAGERLPPPTQSTPGSGRGSPGGVFGAGAGAGAGAATGGNGNGNGNGGNGGSAFGVIGGTRTPGRFGSALAGAGTVTRASSFSAGERHEPRNMSLARTLSSHTEEFLPSRSHSTSPFPTFSPNSTPSTSPAAIRQQPLPHSPPKAASNVSRSRSQSLATGVRPTVDRPFLGGMSALDPHAAGSGGFGNGSFDYGRAWGSPTEGSNMSPFTRGLSALAASADHTAFSREPAYPRDHPRDHSQSQSQSRAGGLVSGAGGGSARFRSAGPNHSALPPTTGPDPPASATYNSARAAWGASAPDTGTHSALTSSVARALGGYPPHSGTAAGFGDVFAGAAGQGANAGGGSGGSGNRSGTSSRRHSVSVVGGPGGRREWDTHGMGITPLGSAGAGDAFGSGGAGSFNARSGFYGFERDLGNALSLDIEQPAQREGRERGESDRFDRFDQPPATSGSGFRAAGAGEEKYQGFGSTTSQTTRGRLSFSQPPPGPPNPTSFAQAQAQGQTGPGDRAPSNESQTRDGAGTAGAGAQRSRFSAQFEAAAAAAGGARGDSPLRAGANGVSGANGHANGHVNGNGVNGNGQNGTSPERGREVSAGAVGAGVPRGMSGGMGGMGNMGGMGGMGLGMGNMGGMGMGGMGMGGLGNMAPAPIGSPPALSGFQSQSQGLGQGWGGQPGQPGQQQGRGGFQGMGGGMGGMGNMGNMGNMGGMGMGGMGGQQGFRPQAGYGGFYTPGQGQPVQPGQPGQGQLGQGQGGQPGQGQGHNPPQRQMSGQFGGAFSPHPTQQQQQPGGFGAQGMGGGFYPPASPSAHTSSLPPLPLSLPPASPSFSSLSLSDLGKGIALSTLPPTTPLYIVTFKAGRRDVFYCPDPTLLISNGDRVVVEADRGSDLGTVVYDQLTPVEVREWQEKQATAALLSGASQHQPPGMGMGMGMPGMPGGEGHRRVPSMPGAPTGTGTSPRAPAHQAPGPGPGPAPTNPNAQMLLTPNGIADLSALDLDALLAGVGPGGQMEVVGTAVRGPLAKEVMPKRIFAKSSQGAEEQARMREKLQDEYEAMMICREKVVQRGLPMQIVDAEYQWDRRKLTFYFKADKRVDFRDLTKENFRIFKSRIWMSMVSKDGASPSPSPLFSLFSVTWVEGDGADTHGHAQTHEHNVLPPRDDPRATFTLHGVLYFTSTSILFPLLSFFFF
ncbi:hypothetical protein IAT38_004015 [Cryptococcus sp. DSM 104549]